MSTISASENRSPPVVLVISGNDPSGGAGQCADVQAISALSCHPAPVITSLTVQDTGNAIEVFPVADDLVARQADAIIDDLTVAAVKIGMLASAKTGRAVAKILDRLPGLPIVLDPVLAATGGTKLADDDLPRVLVEDMVPRCTLITPNADEAIALTGCTASEPAAAGLLAAGAKFVLLTGADQDTPTVINRLYGPGGQMSEFEWPRLANHFHGSGCTLASAIAALLARGNDVPTACESAQSVTWDWLADGYQPGRKQFVPNRCRHERLV